MVKDDEENVTDTVGPGTFAYRFSREGGGVSWRVIEVGAGDWHHDPTMRLEFPCIADPHDWDAIAQKYPELDQAEQEELMRAWIHTRFLDPGPGFEEMAVVASVLDGWMMRVTMSPGQAGNHEVTGIELRPTPGAQVVGAAVLRGLGFGSIIDQAERLLRAPIVGRFVGAPWAMATVRRPGRGGADPRSYAVLAALYVRALRTDPKAPYRKMVQDLADRGQHETEQGLRQKIRRARKLEPSVLTDTVKGKAGGELTEYGRRLAAEMGEEV